MSYRCLKMICFLLPVLGWGQPLSDAEKQELQVIEQQLADLKSRLHRLQLKDMRQEIDSQEYMIADWEKYGEETLSLRNIEHDAGAIQKQIQALKQRRDQLLKNATLL